jgi:lactate racemase
MVIGEGFIDGQLSDDRVAEIVEQAAASLSLAGKRVLMVIPDSTRTMPMPTLFRLFQQSVAPRARALDYLVALGTHSPMNDQELGKLVGQEVRGGTVGSSRIHNHEWSDPSMLAAVGTIGAAEIRDLSGGLLSLDVPVVLNRRIFDYDQIVLVGPVFPHEVVGFSGGNKYLFPGIAGPEIINFTHWLGAVITSHRVIGSGYTPVRAVIDRAASLVAQPLACFALVVTHRGMNGLYFGSPEQAWEAASTLSAKVHIVTVERPFERVLSIMPEMYEDLWTAAKGMYKLEPVVADGGEIVIYAPHVDEISHAHGRLIDEIGYHCRDYFLGQWERFRHHPWGVLAHSTHLKGLGKYDPTTGVEKARIQVTLASRIPAERCQRVNLGYLDPASIHPKEWQGREQEGVLVVPRAGETLYRLAS